MTKTTYFPNVDTRVKSCLKIFNEYNYSDLVRACFCITISVRNRSCLESCLAVNELLFECCTNGVKRIDSYEEFEEFFNRISPMLQPSIADDLTIEDFGEVKLKCDANFYEIIIGTGHNQVYPCLFTLPYLAEFINKKDELKKVLGYHSSLINYFKDVNNDKECKVQFVLPTKALFDRTKSFFENEIDKYELCIISELLGTSDETLIEQRHFVEKCGNIYPVFNTAILVDLYNVWYRNLDERRKSQLVDCAIYNIINDYEQFAGNKEINFLFPVKLYEVESKYECITFNFCASYKDKIILGINENEIDKYGIDNVVEEVQRLKNEGKLSLRECRSRTDDKTGIGITIASNAEVCFVVYNGFLNISEENYTFANQMESKKYFKCSGLDIIDILLFADDIEEIADFITYNFNLDYLQSFSYGGKSSVFFIWKQMGHSIAKGAICYSFVDFGYLAEEDYIYNYFRNQLGNYPWNSKDEFLFSNPFVWNIANQTDGLFKQYVSKYGIGFGGNLTYFSCSNTTLFFPTCLEYIKDDPGGITFIDQVIPIVEDILSRTIGDIYDVFNQSTVEDYVFEIILMPKKYADKVSNGKLKLLDRKYAYSDMNIYQHNICIRYFVDIDKLYQDIQSADNRYVECEFVKEIFMPLKQYFPAFYELLVMKLSDLSKNKKKVEVISYEVDYKWDERCNRYGIKYEYYDKVRKHIASVCLEHKIESGKYYGKKANIAIRNIQQSLLEDFLECIKVFDQRDLHLKLLELYSYSVHAIYLHRKRYNAFINVDETVLSEVREKIINDRETEKHNIRVLLYAIETNLWLERSSTIQITQNELSYILAYANWLLVLSDIADMCHFTKDDIYILVTEEFVIDVYENENLVPEDYFERVYSDKGYAPAYDDIDREYIEKLETAFSCDLGFPIDLFMDFLLYLRKEISDDLAIKLRPNIYSVDVDLAYEEFSQLMSTSVAREQYDLMLDFLTISPKSLMIVNGEHDYYLPIGMKKIRDNRFDIKPIIRSDNTIVYSTVAIYDVFQAWYRPFVDMYVPFETGLHEVKITLEEWKGVYEKQIVYDVEKIFKAERISFVKTNLELYKIDKPNKHPQYLGDYDVFAVDTHKKIIWLIECKVIEKIGTFFDMYSQQNNFFNVHKYDEKFQRRIDYMKTHFKEIVEYYGLPVCEYEIRSYMVMNKVLFPRYKKIEFPIISIGELPKEIKKVSFGEWESTD